MKRLRMWIDIKSKIVLWELDQPYSISENPGSSSGEFLIYSECKKGPDKGTQAYLPEGKNAQGWKSFAFLQFDKGRSCSPYAWTDKIEFMDEKRY